MWLVGVVSSRWVWLVGEGGIYGCGCKEVYRFPHIYYLSLLLLYLFFFAAASILFVNLKNLIYTIQPLSLYTNLRYPVHVS